MTKQSQAAEPSASPSSPFEDLMRVDVACWRNVASRAHDPVTARVIVDLLDMQPELRAKRPGVYLAAREAVQRDRIRYARQYRVGRKVGTLMRWAWHVCRQLLAALSAPPERRVAVAPHGEPLHLQAATPRCDEETRLVFPPIEYPEPANGVAATLH